VAILVTIDPETGDTMEIGASLVGSPRLGLGIAFDSDDNLFVAHRAGAFWSIDTATAQAALVDVTNVLAFGATSNPHPSSVPSPAPEPATLSLFLAALAFGPLASRRRRAA